MNIGFTPWFLSMSICGPVTYTPSLVGGAPLPTYIRFSAASSTFSVFVMAGGITGTYKLQL